MIFHSKKEIILASGSLRRRKILKEAGINFRVISPSVEEFYKDRSKRISSLVKYNASLKARSIARRLNKGIVLGLDTLVLFRNKIFGKFNTREEARSFLKLISGKAIEVYTGICLIDLERGLRLSDYDRTTLYVDKIDPSKIDNYLRYLGPFDKAGGFSIEGIGAVLFDNLKGSYFNVLGLPLRKLRFLMEKMGLDIIDFIKDERTKI